jgi:hypothetical protein
MRTTHLTFSGRVRAAFLAGGTSLVLAAASLAGTALAADQTAQTTAAVEKIGPHTHQLHGTVDATPAAGATSFVVDTERFGKVTVTFAGTSAHGKGHAHGKARASEAASAASLKAGERVIVQGRTSADGTTFTARRVHVLPNKGAARASHLVGTIASAATSNGTTTLSIKSADGSTTSVSVTADTKVRPEGKTIADLTVGTKVTVVSKDGVATGVVVMPA